MISGTIENDPSDIWNCGLPESNPNPVLVISLQGECLFANPAAVALQNECGVENPRDLLPHSWLENLSAGDPLPENGRAARELPGPKMFSWVLSDAGEPGTRACFGADVTSLMHCENALQELQRFEIMGNAASAIAHDFNNYLMAFSMACELLTTEPLTPDGKAAITTAQKNIQGAVGLVKRLRAFGASRESKTDRIPVREFMEAMESTAQLFTTKRIEVAVDKGPEAFVLADRDRLEQAVINIIINATHALEATEQPCLKLNADLQHDSEGTVFWELEISDNGCGMEEEVRKNIFEPFFTTKKDRGGTGLGLATAYSAIRRWNGHLRVESKPGKGTTFTIALPVVS